MNNNFENTEVVEIKQIHRQIEKRKRKKPKFKKFL
jgi:hypothetical protein